MEGTNVRLIEINFCNTQVYTAETNEALKKFIVDDLKSSTGKIRVVIATSALSMGVNIAGLSSVSSDTEWSIKNVFINCMAIHL